MVARAGWPSARGWSPWRTRWTCPSARLGPLERQELLDKKEKVGRQRALAKAKTPSSSLSGRRRDLQSGKEKRRGSPSQPRAVEVDMVLICG